MLHRTRRVLPAALAAALVGGLAACSTDEPEQTVPPAASASEAASPSPSPTDAASKREQEAIDAAKATLTDYYAAENRIAQHGFKDWQTEMVRFWGTRELADSEAEIYRRQVDEGYRNKGEISVASMDVLKYTPDAGGKNADEVAIDLCSDISDVTVHVGNEEVPQSKRANDRFMTKYVMQYHPDQELWGIHELEPDPDSTC